MNRMSILRLDTGNTLEDIAAVLYCKREVYRRYEKGIREPPTWVVIKLAEYYNVSVEYLLGISSIKRPFGWWV